MTWWRQRVSFCRRRALPDRDEAQTQVARLGDEAVQRGLIANGSSKEGVTGGIVPDRQAVEPFRPVVVESALDLDLRVEWHALLRFVQDASLHVLIGRYNPIGSAQASLHGLAANLLNHLHDCLDCGRWLVKLDVVMSTRVGNQVLAIG